MNISADIHQFAPWYIISGITRYIHTSHSFLPILNLGGDKHVNEQANTNSTNDCIRILVLWVDAFFSDGLSVSLICLIPKGKVMGCPNWYFVQNSGISQTRMDHLKMNFDDFQIQRWTSQIAKVGLKIESAFHNFV